MRAPPTPILVFGGLLLAGLLGTALLARKTPVEGPADEVPGLREAPSTPGSPARPTDPASRAPGAGPPSAASTPSGLRPDPEGAEPEAPHEADHPDGEPEEPAPTQTVWPATATGIVGAVKESLPALRDCYEEALAEVPELSGDLKLDLVLHERDGIGEIREVAVVAGELEDAPMEDCVTAVFADLQFDPPEAGPMAITYPVHFTTSD